jgi:hypothetical protein
MMANGCVWNFFGFGDEEWRYSLLSLCFQLHTFTDKKITESCCSFVHTYSVAAIFKLAL